MACHVKMVERFEAVFQELYWEGLWPLLRTFDGIYNYRRKTKGGDWSTHSWGIAIDLNASTNGYGTAGDMPAKVINVFKKHGFTHLKNDPMHFQFCSGY